VSDATTTGAPRARLALALGPVSPVLREALLTHLPPMLPAGWTVEVVGDTTEELLNRAAEDPGWTAILVTPVLAGTPPLPNALAAIMTRWPDLRVALYGPDDPHVRALVRSLAAYGLTNVLFDTTQPTLQDLVRLVTTNYDRGVVQDILAAAVDEGPVRAAEPMGLGPVVAPSPTAPGRVRPIRDKIIAVISGKGGAGKTSLVANLLAIGAGGDAVAALDADWGKPALWTHFFPYNAPPTYADFSQLADMMEREHHRELTLGSLAVTAKDREACRQWVDLCVSHPVHDGILLPGPSRETPLAIPPLPGLYTEVLRQVRERATVTFVDTPLPAGSGAWVELVQQADRLVLVLTPEMEQVLEATAVLARLERHSIPRNRVVVVVNRRAKWGIPTEGIQASVGTDLPIVAQIADQPRVWEQHRQRHRPLALDQPEPWRTLYQHLTGLPAAGPRRRLWGRPRRKAG
jgi:MinD-like ATPase involved in chromosome partitioning or flagellar assembly